MVYLYEPQLINTGKRTEWSLIQCVIIRVITKLRESDLLITSMITANIGQHLPINHEHYNFPEAQDIKTLLGNNHVIIQVTRSLTTLKIIS